MRSIRRSLVIYFLALMGLALGVLSYLIDRQARQTLEDRQAVALRFIDQRYAELKHTERDKFDADLANLATRVAYDVTIQRDKDNDRYAQQLRLASVGGSLMTGLVPNPWLSSIVWSTVPFNRRVNDSFGRAFFGHLSLPEDTGSDVVMAVVQGNPDKIYRSRTAPMETWEAAVPVLEPNKISDEKFETRTLRDGNTARMVTLQYLQGSRFPRSRPNFNPPPGMRVAPPRPEPSPESVALPSRTVFIRCARQTAPLDETLKHLEAARIAEHEEEMARTIRDRDQLRSWLGIVSLFTFSCLLAGGTFLVYRGLRPLNILSDAVAQVTEKDFRLPVEKTQLSVELVPIHTRLTETLEQLRRAFEHDKQAVADISHELRTPVAALLATLDVTLRKPRDAEHYRQALTECRSITKQLQQLVERVMLLASLDASPSQTVNTDVNARELAENCATVIRPLAEAHGLTVKTNLANDVKIRTDGDKLREVLLNLLHNAVEYNKPGGEVTLSLRNGGPQAIFSVADTGIGMTPDVRNRIFERFYRADPSRTATGLHAGLGLAIVKECVDRLGGTIQVESKPGEGSCFEVALPA